MKKTIITILFALVAMAGQAQVTHGDCPPCDINYDIKYRIGDELSSRSAEDTHILCRA